MSLERVEVHSVCAILVVALLKNEHGSTTFSNWQLCSMPAFFNLRASPLLIAVEQEVQLNCFFPRVVMGGWVNVDFAAFALMHICLTFVGLELSSVLDLLQ